MKRIVLKVPDEMSDAIESEYEERTARISDSLSNSGWERQSESVEEALDNRADDVSDMVLEILRLEVC